MKEKLILIILDGWGYSKKEKFNAPFLAKTPTYDFLLKNYPSSNLYTHGKYVGLPDGQMGNSQVGHANIGAGRVIMQILPKINKTIEDKSYKENFIYKKLIKKTKENKSTIHLMCLLSDGGVHSHINHFLAYANNLSQNNIDIKFHLFTDGRDVSPKSAKKYLDSIPTNLVKNIATISGRYYSMDRDNNWDRISLSYDAIVNGKSDNKHKSYIELLNYSYKNNITDEFIEPSVINNYSGIKENDSVLMCNFRNDRVRQLLEALIFNNANFKNAKKIKSIVGIVPYSKEIDKEIDILIPEEKVKNTLSEIISKNGLKQLKIAETEKYPHVTFFFNNGVEKPFLNEERVLIPSPKVKTYDLKPEMSAFEITESLLNKLKTNAYNLTILNFANPDMVGHTGSLDAAIKACNAIDKCLKEIWEYIKKNDYTLLITADHGNCEIMYNEEKKEPHTAHTLNLVKFIIANNKNITSIQNGKLSNIAPTILEILNIDKPSSMNCRSLING